MAKKKEEKLEVPMSAMIDVVFLLLIYFIATFQPNIVEAHMAINLPGPSRSTPPPDTEPPQTVQIYIKPDGLYWQGASKVGPETLVTRLTQIGQIDTQYTVEIKVDGDAREYQLVQVLDMCNKAGLEQLNVLELK
ncbi:MAG: biopolymer transporter ExbD [Lentisphaeria bacterium]|nr:biopolymer transporter ExbD [Lentisphaeria bacterium]